MRFTELKDDLRFIARERGRNRAMPSSWTDQRLSGKRTMARVIHPRSQHSPKVSIVVPVYRNADTLRELHRRLCRAMESLPLSYELLFVDDACPEGSLEVLRELAERDSQVAVLALERNVAQQRAVLIGLAHARGDYVVVMDADLQDPPEAIPDLLAKAHEGFDAVFAGRRGHYESRSRLLSSRLFKGLLHLVSGVPADAGLFVAMNRRMVDRLLTYRGPHPFVVAMIGCTGLPVVSIPVARAQRLKGSSAYSFWGRLKVGSLALAWVPLWKWFPSLRDDRGRVAGVTVRAYIGARFASTDEHTTGEGAGL